MYDLPHQLSNCVALKVDCGIVSGKRLQFLNLVILRLMTTFEKMLFKVSVRLNVIVSFTKISILDVWHDCQYVPGVVYTSFAELIYIILYETLQFHKV